MKTTSPQAMEVILDLYLFELHDKVLALKSNLRLRKNGNWSFLEGEVTRPENHTESQNW